jgi:hypothetical protein
MLGMLANLITVEFDERLGIHLISLTTQRGIMATPFPALLRSRGRPSPLHRARGKGSALPTHPRLRRGYPTERGGPPPLVGLSPGLCGPGGTVAYFTHRTVEVMNQM